MFTYKFIWLQRFVRGFESPSHRHILKKSLNESSGFFLPVLQRIQPPSVGQRILLNTILSKMWSTLDNWR